MRIYALVMALSALATVALVPILKRMAMAIGAVDYPSERRKIHAGPIPRLGGVAIFLPVAFGLILGIKGLPEGGQRLMASELLGLLAGCGCIFLLGLCDDIRGVSAPTKLVVQFVAACILYFAGAEIPEISTPFGESLRLGIFAFPFTILWVVGLTNGMNLLDGIDGLAAGVSAMGALTVLLVSLGQGGGEISLIASALIGSSIGFLFYNFHPASIFLGDCGAMFLGFVLAAIPIFGSQKTATAVALLVPIIALGIPIFDTVMAIVRRSIRGKHPFDSDREHVHHRLLALGLSQRQVALTMYLVCAVLTVLAVWMTRASRTGALLILGFIGMAGVIGIRRLGMDEVMTLWGIARHGERRRRSPRHRLRLVKNTVPLLEMCETVASVKALLEEVRHGLEFQSLTIRLNEEIRVADFGSSSELVVAVGKNDLSPTNEVPSLSTVKTIGPVDIVVREPHNHRGLGNGRGNGVESGEPRTGSRETGYVKREVETLGRGRAKKIVGKVVATKPAWKCRRASEYEDELLQMLAEGMGKWAAKYQAHGS